MKNLERIMSADAPVDSSVELRIYPNQFKHDDFEKVNCAAGITFHDYLIANVPSYHERPVPLFSVLLNDKPLPFDQWKSTHFAAGDLVECMIEPKGIEASVIMAVIAVASAAYAIHMANQPLPDTYNNTSPNGSSIYDVNAQGNKPRLMGTVPVLMGHHKIYADYLNAPRTVYRNNKKIFYAMLSCGVGEMEILPENILIGDTQVLKYGDDVSYEIFPPGADVSGHEAHLNEYRSVEVGSSDGSSGLELVGAEYALDWVRNLGSYYYVWEIQDNTKAMKMFFGMLAADNLIYNYVPSKWQKGYTEKTGSNLINKVLEFYSEHNISWGFYRVVSNISSVESVFEKLNGDFTVDTSWTGFNNDFQARFRVVDTGDDLGLVGPFSAVPFGETTDKLILDFRFNNGLARLNNNGDAGSSSVRIELQWRNDEGAAWQKRVETFTAATRDQLAYTLEIAVSVGSKPDVRIRRLTASTDDILIKDKIEWASLRSSLKSVASYPGITTIAFEITGTDELANAAENKIGLVPTRKLQKFDDTGSMTAYGPTRSISSALYAIATELGHEIDMDELWRLHQVWEARGDYFDAVYDNATTSWKAMQQVLAVGFAEPTLDFGKIIPVRDEKRTFLDYQYQPDNMLPNSWKMDGSFVDGSENDGIEVEYFSDETWKSDTVMCLLPGDAGDNPEKIRAFGITNKQQAYRFGMRKRATQKHRRIRHQFSTEMDALNSRYMSHDALGIDMPGYSQTGRVEAVSGRELVLNNDVDWTNGVNHYIGVRKPTGRLSGPYLCSPGSSSDSVVINADLDFEPVFNGSHEPPFYQFGTEDDWCIKVLVTDIKPTGTDKVKVTAFEYSDDVYLYDDEVLG